MYEATIAVGLGIFFAAVTAKMGRSMSPRAEHRFFTVVMVATALIFVGFPAEAGDQLGLVAESVAGVAFLALAGLGMAVHPIWLPVTYLFHGAWDLAYVVDVVQSTKPDWTVEFCAPYDTVLGIYMLTRVHAWSRARQGTVEEPNGPAAPVDLEEGERSPPSPEPGEPTSPHDGDPIQAEAPTPTEQDTRTP